MSIGVRPSCVGLRLLNLHALQFVIVLRVIIVHFGCYLMKHCKLFCILFLADFTVLAKSSAKVMILIEIRKKKPRNFFLGFLFSSFCNFLFLI